MLEPNLCFRNMIDGFFFFLDLCWVFAAGHGEDVFINVSWFHKPFFSISNFDGDFLTRSAYKLSFSIPKYKNR